MAKHIDISTTTVSARGSRSPYALGPEGADLIIHWPDGHRVAVVGTAFHGGDLVGTAATGKEAWELLSAAIINDCACGCAGFVFRDPDDAEHVHGPDWLIDAAAP